MNDNVAVLREMREHLAIFAEGAEGARRRGMDGDLAALAHAIAICEQHAALVARLGELRDTRRMLWMVLMAAGGSVTIPRDMLISFSDAGLLERTDLPWGDTRMTARCADDLARVVKENG